LKPSEELASKKFMAKIYNSIGIIYNAQGDFPKAHHYYFKALKIDEELVDKESLAPVLNNIGIVYMNQGNYPKALDYFFKGLKLDEELNNKIGMAYRFGNIGIVYLEQGDHSKALTFYFKALKMDEELGNKNGIARHLGNIGIVYKEQGVSAKALDYFFRALKIDEELKNKNGIARHLGNIGIVYKERGDLELALKYNSNALKADEEIGNKFGVTLHLGNIGSIYLSQKKYKLAYDHLYHALSLADSIGANDYLMTFYEYLSTLYEKSTIPLQDSIGGKLLNMEDMRLRALTYHKRSLSLKQIIFSEENKKQLVQKEMNFEFEKKEALAKAEQAKKDEVTHIIIYSVSAGLLLVLLLAIFIFRGYKQNQKANKIIAEKNKDITDSITYAKRIQQAILPSIDSIKEKLPNSFVLYKPKDIVAGDFYWFHTTETKLFIAAADCTGHGVPGAFMSIIGYEKLNEAVGYSSETKDASELIASEVLNISHPITDNLSLILQNVNIRLKRLLHQTDSSESTRDGMDIAICSIDTENRIVTYAGANRPIWIIRKGQNVVEEIKATKKAIGGFTEDNQHFDTHEIKLQPGDTFYLSTDGYADTFSRQDKKLTTKKFKELLISIQGKSMQEQEKHLDHFIEDWKGEIEQIDDILVIGIQL